MKKENLINEIDQILESLKSHINRIKNDQLQTHKLDVDVLIEKTRKLYDTLISLDTLTVTFDIETSENKVYEEVTEEKVEFEVQHIDNIEPKEEIAVQEELEDEQVAVPEPEVEEVIEKQKETPVETTSEEELEIDIEQPKNEETETTENEFHIKSTIDLFSTTAEPSLGDKLEAAEATTVADKITRDAINELREAIGINEKFQFINELFNGDMNRYNKIIDELDQLATLEGVNAYMIELKIQHQWADDNPSLVKLSELLQRKFTGQS